MFTWPLSASDVVASHAHDAFSSAHHLPHPLPTRLIEIAMAHLVSDELPSEFDVIVDGTGERQKKTSSFVCAWCTTFNAS